MPDACLVRALKEQMCIQRGRIVETGAQKRKRVRLIESPLDIGAYRPSVYPTCIDKANRKIRLLQKRSGHDDLDPGR